MLIYIADSARLDNRSRDRALANTLPFFEIKAPGFFILLRTALQSLHCSFLLFHQLLDVAPTFGAPLAGFASRWVAGT